MKNQNPYPWIWALMLHHQWCYQKLCDEPESTVGHYIPSVAQHRVLHRTLVEHQSNNSKLFYLWGLGSFIFFVPQQ